MTVHDHRRGLVVVHRMLDRCSPVFLAAALLAAGAAPLAAQGGRDLLAPEPPVRVGAVRSGLAPRAADFPVSVRVRDVRAAYRDAVGVPLAATELYQYDDDDFEADLYLVDSATDEPLYEFELAQRFRLSGPGTVAYAVICMGRGIDDTNPDVDFGLNFYSDAGSTPGSLLGAFEGTVRIEQPGRYSCFTLRGAVQGLALDGGPVWVAVSWLRATPPENTKFLMADENGPGGGRRAFRARVAEGEDWTDWAADSGADVKAYGIRLAVDHPDPDPEPDPDPDPEPDPDPDPEPPSDEGYTDCEPQTTPLVFDGGYGVGLCYETPSGQIGEGKGGIWASGESGLLWFFSRGNAEALVKVLNGCAHNGHRWVFVAPVTDVAFNLYVTDGEGKRWSHRNRQGEVAVPARDTFAFPCRE